MSNWIDWDGTNCVNIKIIQRLVVMIWWNLNAIAELCVVLLIENVQILVNIGSKQVYLVVY